MHSVTRADEALELAAQEPSNYIAFKLSATGPIMRVVQEVSSASWKLHSIQHFATEVHVWMERDWTDLGRLNPDGTAR